jgi:hypothetical protein
MRKTSQHAAPRDELDFAQDIATSAPHHTRVLAPAGARHYPAKGISSPSLLDQVYKRSMVTH